jgi:hypothetical protein
MATRRTADGFKISCLSSTLLHLTLNVYFNENNVPSDYWVLESLKKITKNGETLVNRVPCRYFCKSPRDQLDLFSSLDKQMEKINKLR